MRARTIERYAYVLMFLGFHGFFLFSGFRYYVIPRGGFDFILFLLFLGECRLGVEALRGSKTFTCFYGSYLFFHGAFLVFFNIFDPLYTARKYTWGKGMQPANYLYIAVGVFFMAAGIRLYFLGRKLTSDDTARSASDQGFAARLNTLPKSSSERFLIVLGLLAIKVSLLILNIAKEEFFETACQHIAYAELGLLSVLGVLTVMCWRLPTVLLGGYMLISGIIALIPLFHIVIGAAQPGQFGEMPHGSLLEILLNAVIVVLGLRVIRLAIRKGESGTKSTATASTTTD